MGCLRNRSALKDLNFAEFKRLGLLSKTFMDVDQWLA